MLSLTDPIAKLHLVRPAHEKALNKLGIKNIEDLLRHYPRDWQDLTEIKTIAEIRPGNPILIRARVKQVANPGFPFRRVKITEALLEDTTGNVAAVWFNQPYLKNTLKVGQEYYFAGKGQLYTGKKQQTLQLAHPTFEQVKEDTIHVAGIIPEYPLTEGLTQKQFRYWLKQGLETLTDMTDLIPRTIRTRMRLMDVNSAIRNIHFPEDNPALAAAKKRLAFEELFLFQLAFQGYKQTLKNSPAPTIPLDTKLVTRFVQSLPFSLTGSQRLASWEILNDLSAPHPMNRLLEGEVGSGKTVVAGLGMYSAAHAGFQSVLLAPTEILPLQHYETLKKLFAHTDLEIALLTRSHKTHPPAGGPNSIFNIPIVIGTHALLQDKINFKKIGLLVIDEQHRFGVKQRQALLRGQTQTETQTNADRSQRQSVSSPLESVKVVPHLLSMTATPIPRTLALAFYGDLDISRIAELPSGRKKVITRLVAPENRAVAYEFIRKELARGRQAYVIVPLVEETDGEKKSVATETEKLRKIFPEFAVSMLHGRMDGGEKKQVMEDFKSNQTQILVSTTVVEVGVDVPNATIIIIENAERFGLSTLHQLRGRVGRGKWQSLCILFTESVSETTRSRLEAVVKSNDGFELAEIDLKLRGAGEMLGARQSGYIPFKIASLSDTKLIETAKAEALDLLAQDPMLSGHPKLAQKVNEISREAHLE